MPVYRLSMRFTVALFALPLLLCSESHASGPGDSEVEGYLRDRFQALKRDCPDQGQLILGRLDRRTKGLLARAYSASRPDKKRYLLRSLGAAGSVSGPSGPVDGEKFKTHRFWRTVVFDGMRLDLIAGRFRDRRPLPAPSRALDTRRERELSQVTDLGDLDF
jgi:hypothetical protein